MFKGILSQYSLSQVFLEVVRSITGYYLDLEVLRGKLRRINKAIVLCLFTLLFISLLAQIFSFAVVKQVSPSLVPKWNSMGLWSVFTYSYGDFFLDTSITQSHLLLMAIQFILVKIALVLSLFLVLCAFYKFILLVSVMTHRPKLTKPEWFNLCLNPSSFSTDPLLNKPSMKRKPRIRLSDVMNKFLDLQRFPELDESSSTLITAKDLTFMYHGDNEWDKYIHIFLKKYFPSLYHRHLLSSNTRNKEDALEKKHIQALHNINVSIKNFTFTTILGCNGSSKTTFLKAIINLFEKYSGNIVWITKDLKSISHKSFYKHVAYVAQDNLIHNKITVYDYVACGLFPSFSFFKFNYPKDHPIILRNLSKMGIIEHRDKDMNSLSGGEKQKAILARVLTQQTDVIILDEPTTYLDINNQYLILNLLKKLQLEENKTIITILHDIKQAEQFSDEVILLDNGEVFAYGKTNEVITKSNIEKVFEVPWRAR